MRLAPRPDAGEAIYRRGVTGSGAPLEARRDGAETELVRPPLSQLSPAQGFGGREAAPSSRRSPADICTVRAQGRRRQRHPYVEGMRGVPEP